MSYSNKVTIINETGLHARPATIFVQKASSFQSKITIEKDGKDLKANAKSIMFLLALGVHKGDSVTITADGVDEIDAVNSLIELISNDFDEK